MDLFDVLPAATPTEEAERDAALAVFEVTRASLLRWLRREMRELYARRVEEEKKGGPAARVTADDARAILDNDPRVPPPDRLCRNFMGQLFKTPGWRATGQFIKSKTKGSHANLLCCWRYQGGIE